jgi:restriction system protein
MPDLAIVDLKAIIRDLDSSAGPGISPAEAERKLAQLLEPLLRQAGYVLEESALAPRDRGYDFVARRSAGIELGADELVIEYKHYRQAAIGVDQVRRLLGAAVMSGVTRAMLVTNTRFTQAAREAIRMAAPVALELIDIDALRSWVGRLEEVPSLDLGEIAILRKGLSQKLIALIAKHPRYLEGIEWRELEYLLTEVFERLGFSATITPGSKDGGKDIILNCRAASATRKYYVEIKHWCSGQRVGQKAMKEFLNVIINEEISGGLYLSTYGYCSNAIESLTEIERRLLRFGDDGKIVALCKTYQRAITGLWIPEADPVQLLYDETV